MGIKIPVEGILDRVPERAQSAYTNLVTHESARYDEETGWSCAYLTQQALADEMGVSLRTATRAVSDLRQCGLVRVLVWPGARTETQVRVSDICINSVFGPIHMCPDMLSHNQLVDCAIAFLLESNKAMEDRMSQG